jgi:restriction system protein
MGFFNNLLDLFGLSQSEYYDLLSRRLGRVDADFVRRLWASTQGHVLAGDLASRTIRQNLLTWNELLQAVEGATRSGIFGPDGNPIQPSGVVPSPIVVAVSEVNEELLRMLRQDPTKLYSLSPRKFEEVVAELMSKLGYVVDLTPASADGGFDMYAARKDGLGRFLYLVECKRFAPSHRIGVQIVRSLYGVVQQKRANAGIIATTSFFTKGAKELQQQLEYQMHLQDYLALQQWLK